MCGGHRKSRTVRRQVLLSPEFRGGGDCDQLLVKSFLPLELYFLVSTLQKVRAVFLILLLYLREACRPLTDTLTLPGHVSLVF